MEEVAGEIRRVVCVMRIWQQFRTFRGALAIISALLAIALGLLVLIDMAGRWDADSTGPYVFYRYLLPDIIFGGVPLAGGLVGIWRGSVATLLAAWAFTTGLAMAGTLDFTARLAASDHHAGGLHLGDFLSLQYMLGNLSLFVAAIGLLLVSLSLVKIRRKAQSESVSG